MVNRLQVFEHLGPYEKHEPVRAACNLTERLWVAYHELAGGHEHENQSLEEYLYTRMIYIAEVTSTAIRMNATWALTHAAMSLLRDRYEQVVRFSWLMRSPDADAYDKYARGYFSKMNALIRDMPPTMRKAYDEIMGEPPPEWTTTVPSREDKDFFNAWGSLDLKSMAIKRDALPLLAEKGVAKEPLAIWYGPIYSQFSSVSHYDRYSIELLGLHKNSAGQHVMSAEPYWPAMLTAQNCLLDFIQCYEATRLCHHKDATPLDALFTEWSVLAEKMVG